MSRAQFRDGEAIPSELDRESAATLEGCRPASKLVHLVLRREGGMANHHLREETRLPRKTAESATTELESEGLLQSRQWMPDARRMFYELCDSRGDEA